MQTFVIITHERSGTQTLHAALSGHPKIAVFSYWFDASRPIAMADTEIRKNPERNWHHQAWLEFLRGNPEGVSHLGTWTHWVRDSWARGNVPVKRPEDYWLMLREKAQKCLLLRRRNILRQYLSTKIALASGVYATIAPRNFSPEPIRVSPEALQGYIEQKETADKMLRSVFADDFLEVIYEELIGDWNAEFRRVQEYLEVSLVEVPIPTCRQEHRPLREIVRNYDELETYLTEQGRQDWLDD